MIASWMLYSLAVGALLAAVAVLAERVLRLLGRPVRGIWAVAITLAVTLPLLTTLRPSRSATAPGDTSGTVESMMLTLDPPTTALAGLPTLPALPALDAPLLAAWALLSLTLLGALLHGVGVLQGRRREWRRAQVDGREVLVAADLGPAVIGWRRMQIVLPAWALALDTEARGLILLHEEEHIRRRDPGLLFGGLLAVLLVPWNAALWYLYRRLRLAIELDCDARVVAGGADLARYGEVLLVAGSKSRSEGLPALATFAERATQLESRITALVPTPVRRRGAKALASGLLATAALLAACTMENPLGIDLTDAEHPVKLRFDEGLQDPVQAAMIRTLARRLAEQRFPGAVAQGGVPEEAVIFMVLNPARQILAMSMHLTHDRNGPPSALAELPADQIETIEVIKGPAVGIENLGVVLATVKEGAMLPRRRSPGPEAEVPVGELRAKRPMLQRGATAPSVDSLAGANRQSGEIRLPRVSRVNPRLGQERR